MCEKEETGMMGDTELRLGFIRKVFGILFCQLTLTACLVLYVISDERNRAWLRFTGWGKALFFGSFVGAISIMCSLLFCMENMVTVPLNYILLFTFTICESILVAYISAIYEP